MRLMSCKKLGGAFEKRFTANTFDELANENY